MSFPSSPVYLIIPVHNRKATTLACLEQLKQNGVLERYHTVVIDDGSTDGTAEAIQSLYPGTIVLRGDGNLWWTGAIRYGMEYAVQQGAEYLIWLNDDCRPEAQAIPKLVEFLQSNPQTIAGAACYLAESGALLENGVRGRQRFAAAPGTVIFVEGMAGYCVGIPTAVVRRIGLPNAARFPHYAGDDTYILRATRQGIKACLVGDARVVVKEMAEPAYDFGGYVQARFPQGRSLQLVFWNKKSRYYLPAQFFYHVEKYGWIIGIGLFLAKFSGWFVKYIKLCVY